MLVFTSCGCAACVCVRRVNAAASYTPANSLTDTAKIQLKHERRDGRPFGQNLGPKVLSTQEAGTGGWGMRGGGRKGERRKGNRGIRVGSEGKEGGRKGMEY